MKQRSDCVRYAVQVEFTHGSVGRLYCCLYPWIKTLLDVYGHRSFPVKVVCLYDFKKRKRNNFNRSWKKCRAEICWLTKIVNI